MFDASSMTLRDARDLMEHLGKPTLNEALECLNFEEGNLDDEAIKAVQYVVFMMRRKSDPEFTLDAAMDVSMGELKELMASALPPTPVESSVSG